MMADAFTVLCAIFAVVATFSTNFKTSVLSLWMSGLAAGGLYLTLGTDTLAVIQWISATLVAVSFVFFSMMFGEFSEQPGEYKNLKKTAKNLVFILLGGGFAAVVYVGIQTGLKESGPTIPLTGDLSSMGKIIPDYHFLSFEVLALLLFLVLVGGGVIARPDSGGSE